jgi:tungstate transport system ATP-binding protein
MTTTIALETSKGNLALALGLGIVLLCIVIAINGLTSTVQWLIDRQQG